MIDAILAHFGNDGFCSSRFPAVRCVEIGAVAFQDQLAAARLESRKVRIGGVEQLRNFLDPGANFSGENWNGSNFGSRAK